MRENIIRLLVYHFIIGFGVHFAILDDVDQ